MSCYHPLVGFKSDYCDENGKRKVKILSLRDDESYEDLVKNGAFLIPCGHCIGCRLDYSRSWADRMMLELETMKKAVFVTLTYDNEHCPPAQFDENDEVLYYTLNKRDCQLFMKRLRKEFDGVKIRFFLSGEYGTRTLRPHYHAIIYGIGLFDVGDCKPFKRNDLGQSTFVSEKIQKIWNNGFVLLSDVSWETCAYVARYVTKKLSGDAAISYAERNCVPEFSLMSRRPGIASDYLSIHPDCLDYSSVNIMTKDGGKKIAIPKYFLKKLELKDKDRYDKLMVERRKFASDSTLLELSKTDLGLAEYLEVKEMNRKAKIKALKRKDL